MNRSRLADLARLFWVIFVYCLVAYCVWKGDWQQGTFWLAWLILDSMKGEA